MLAEHAGQALGDDALDRRGGEERLDAHLLQAGDRPGASFVCSVVSTMCPVSAASIAIRAVSASRISPTMITSGSARRTERSPVANVSPALRLTPIC